MAGHRYRDRVEVEKQFAKPALVKAWLSVVGQGLSLVFAAVFGLIAVKHANDPSAWPTLRAASGAFLFTGSAAAFGRLEPKEAADDSREPREIDVESLTRPPESDSIAKLAEALGIEPSVIFERAEMVRRRGG